MRTCREVLRLRATPEVQISAFLANKPGIVAGLCGALAERGVNIRALTVLDTVDIGTVRMIVVIGILLCGRPWMSPALAARFGGRRVLRTREPTAWCRASPPSGLPAPRLLATCFRYACTHLFPV